jgi:hypothetical protein
MEACYAEGSKSRGDAVPQISLRPLAHQNCIRRDRIVAVAPANGDSGQSFGLVSSLKPSQQPLRFLLRQSPSDHRLRHSPLVLSSTNKCLAQSNKSLDLGRATKRRSALPATQSGGAEYRRLTRSANLPWPANGWGLFSVPWIMKPRTVYDKAVQDFTQTARLQATLNQHFRQASFAEFEMLMGLDDEVLKRYGLPRSILERALIEVYRTVVLNQEKSRPLDRRRCKMSGKKTVLGTAAVAIAIASTSVAGAAESIRIGELNSYTAGADFTRPYRNGWIMAIEEINAAGGVVLAQNSIWHD